MDVMKPKLLYVGGRCYRKMPFEQNFGQVFPENGQRPRNEGLNEEEPVCDDEPCDADNLLQKTVEGYKLPMTVPSSLFRFIIGVKGDTKRKIEKETKTQITVPKQGQEGDIVITGRSKSGVMGARSRIEVIAESSRHKIPFTHFLSFPLYKSDLIKKMEEFKAKVLEDCSECRGVDSSIFQLPAKIHLTVAMLTLLNEREVKNASDLLSCCYQELVSNCLQGSSAVIELKGVEYMNDDPGEVDVLYAKVVMKDGSDRLQRMADAMVDRFVREGLVKREYDRVKLHATVMNSKLRDNLEGETPAKKSRVNDVTSRLDKRMSFDARKIVRLFEEFHFGEYHLDTIHLSTRGSYDSDGHYACAASVPLP